METKFTQFLRSGGNGEFLIKRKADAWVGGRTALSIKSEFPNYAALRDNFAARLDAVIQASHRPILLKHEAQRISQPQTATLFEATAVAVPAKNMCWRRGTRQKA